MAVKQILPKFLLAQIFIIAAWSHTGHAFQPVPAFEDRTFAIGAHTEYFTTDANLTKGGGGYATLGQDRSFETISTRLFIDYKLQKNWRIGGGGDVVHAKSTNWIEDRQTTELNSVFLDSLYVVRQGRLLFAPQFRYVQSLHEVEEGSDDIIAGEGTNQFEFGTWAAFKVGPFEPYTYVAYRGQNDGRANLLPFQVGVRYYYEKIYVIGEVYGHLPLSKDEYSTAPARRTSITDLRNAGSLRFYAVDPSVYEGRGELGYKIAPNFAIYGGGAHTIDGKSAAYGLTLSAGLLYTFGADERTRESFADDDGDIDFTEDEVAKEYRKKQPKSRRVKKKKESFQPLRDDYDESLFTPNN